MYANVFNASAEDGLSLIFVLQNTMEAKGHDSQLLPFDFKFPFQNKSILTKLSLIYKMTYQVAQYNKKIFCKKMSLKKTKTLKKC